MSARRVLSLSSVIIVFALAGCSGLFPPDPPPGPIVGSWYGALGGNSFGMTLTTARTFTQASLFSGVSHTYAGTYTNNSSIIVFSATVVDGIGVAPQDSTADYSLSPDSSSMVLSYTSNTPLVLNRL
jgi:hypothetical protein